MKVAVTILLLWISFVARAEELSVAAASDLNFALRDIAASYQRKTGNTLKISFGSSGNFFTQIRNGAPFDVFLSADINYPRQLENAGFSETGTLYRYAIGKVVLWVPNTSKINLSRGMVVLLDPAVRKIAIANPRHAPYGQAAEAALKKAGIYDNVRQKLVLGENISQTAQFVETGNADIGVIALSLAVSPTMKARGRFVEVPTDLYPALEQAAVVLKASKDKELAKQFVEYLSSPEIRAILKKYGFQ